MGFITENSDGTPVLIVGGSLVGLSAAVFLSWRGVPVVVIDKHHGSSSHPRAIGFTTRTVEHFRQVGVEVPMSPQSMEPPRRARVESLAGNWTEEYPWTPGGGAYGAEQSPVQAIAITQDRLEPLLRERARELGADLRLGTELLGLTQDDGGVTATLRRRDDGHEYRMHAQYVVAADGADSGIRTGLGIERHGVGPLSVQRSILFRAPLEEYLRHGVVQFEIEQPDFRAFLTTYSDGRWVLMLSDDIERDPGQQIEVVRRAIGRTDIPIELLTTGRWKLAGLIADRFSVGRIFLAGDAAHQLPPNRGGFGANTGIDDVHNLAWKLAAVLSGCSDSRLLETYDAERRPIADLRHDQLFARADYKAYLKGSKSDTVVLDDAAIELGQLYRSTAVLGVDDSLPQAQRPDRWAGQPGTRAPHLWVTVDGHTRSTLDLIRHDWVLLSVDDRWRAAAAQVSEKLGIAIDFDQIGTDVELDEPGVFEGAYGVEASGATLIRPDGYIAWRTRTAPQDRAGELASALATTAAAAGVSTMTDAP
ncbi:FAD-dependent oxidoreductase [Nocardia pseudobrasiliensis]|uniref:2-polyprenyl-6-methoxyphenol hydroxylase-like FAD-dependent oxidoreductase n=1 Tax=Nocardia pseudobrasiliensis TaxID=45979 RepID=A0A370IFW3_9NOCA|nr:FAD-dependent oxidoreductase [Nocardia pseudobrasiliensis]RDI68344.1 2-polyprenyl-6-methoxyphenol hydroxylase-like FAD-dependent oxidoreductase [Nocardia pseudobrasiliensis]